MTMYPDTLEFYTIFQGPMDHPGKFVVRRFVCFAGAPRADKEPLAVVDTLEDARQAVLGVRGDVFRIGRNPSDKLSVVESWI